MTPTLDLIQKAQAEGVRLALSREGVRLFGDTETVNRWLPELRQHKPEIRESLAAIVSWLWLVHYVDRDPVKVATWPMQTHDQILAHRPDAVAAEIWEPLQNAFNEVNHV